MKAAVGVLGTFLVAAVGYWVGFQDGAYPHRTPWSKHGAAFLRSRHADEIQTCKGMPTGRCNQIDNACALGSEVYMCVPSTDGGFSWIAWPVQREEPIQ